MTVLPTTSVTTSDKEEVTEPHLRAAVKRTTSIGIGISITFPYPFVRTRSACTPSPSETRPHQKKVLGNFSQGAGGLRPICGTSLLLVNPPPISQSWGTFIA